MKTNKPDIFLGVTLFMLVLAVILCIAIGVPQKKSEETTSGSGGTEKTHTQMSANSSNSSDSTGESAVSDSTEPVVEPGTPVELKPIDEAGLKAELDKALEGLGSEWQVVVMDPVLGTRVASAVNCEPDAWMTANKMTQLFLMGTVFQQAKDESLKLESVQDDVKAMIVNRDLAAADRLTEMIGGGDAAKGREAVKTFATSYGVKLGYNRPLNGTSDSKNYVTAQQNALLLDKLCRGELVSEAASEQMLELLMTERETDISIAFTAENVTCGFITDVEDGICICAMGVVKLPNRSFVISVVCNKPVTTDGAKKKVAELVSIAEGYFAK